MAEELIKTRYRVVLPAHGAVADSAVCEVMWPREPGYGLIRSLVEPLVGGNIEHVAVLSDFDGGHNFGRADVFVNEDGHADHLPRNEVATTIYRRATLCGRSGAPHSERSGGAAVHRRADGSGFAQGVGLMGVFIISHHRFKEHDSFFQAQGEMARLRGLYPERDYQIYQVRRVPIAAACRPQSDKQPAGETC